LSGEETAGPCDVRHWLLRSGAKTVVVLHPSATSGLRMGVAASDGLAGVSDACGTGDEAQHCSERKALRRRDGVATRVAWSNE